jgi:environmental stress-induced protein Ves
MIVQRAIERIAVPWRNGLGVQFEIICDGSLPDDWTWRLSTADITQDVPFSSFYGVIREFCVAEGNGVTLNINGVDHRCKPGSITKFRGDDEVLAALIDGSMQALNLMQRDGSATRPLQIARVGQHIARCQVIVAVMGSASVEVANQVVELGLLDAIIDLEGMDAVVHIGAVAAF